MLRLSGSLCFALALAACGSSSSSAAPAPAATLDDAGDGAGPASDGGVADAGGDGSAEAGPSLASVMPQVRTGSGPVLASPKAIVISFPDDPLAAGYESAASVIAGSAYWTQTTSEYGVGTLTALAPVHLQNASPTSLTDDQIQSVLQTAIANTANAFPTPDASTIYTLLIPNGVPVTGAGGAASCGFAGYHRSFALSSGVVIPYAVIVECQAAVAETRTIAHELAEAATDPFAATSNPAYVGVGPQDLGFVVGTTLGSELADMCETTNPFILEPQALKLARIWSNAAARTGTNPCLPVPPGEPWFFALPNSLPPDQVVGTKQKGSMPAIAGSGFALATGHSRVVALGMLGDPGTAPWTVAVHEVTQAGLVTFALDHATGQAGDVLQLTITAVGDTSSGVPFAIDSTLGATTNTWLGVVGAPE